MGNWIASGSNTDQTSVSASGVQSQSNEATVVRGPVGTVNINNSSIIVKSGNSVRAKFDNKLGNVVPGNSNEESRTRNFRTVVNARSLRQSVGGVTDSFKEQDLHEPSFEANPRMKRLTRFYYGELELEECDYKSDPIFCVSANDSEKADDDNMISPKDLVDAISDEKQRVVAVAGQAGSGKTTLMKRLVRDVIISNNLTESQTPGGSFVKHFTEQRRKFELVHFLNVRDLYVGSRAVTAQELLFYRHLERLDEEEIQCGYEWLKKNQEKVLFVFDGLDQAKWTMPTKFSKIIHTDKADMEVVLANILSGNLFEDAQILLSSREHSIASLTNKLRPNLIVAMMGLTLKDIETIFNELQKSFADDDGIEDFKSLPPAILPLCSIPLFLIYCAIIHKFNRRYRASTMTEVLFQILKIFMRSVNVFEEDIPRIITILKKISFDGHLQKRVTFTLVELEKYGLNRKKIRGAFMIKVPGSSILSQNLFDGDYRIFFSHQTLQEIFAAMYICEKEVDVFRSFACNELCQPHWSVVRRFVCGLLSNPECQDSEIFQTYGKTEKWRIFKETLQNMEDSYSSDRLELLAILYESQDRDLIQSRVTEINFNNRSFTPAAIHAISSVMRCCQHLTILRLHRCGINWELAEILERTTRNTKLKIRRLDVSDNPNLAHNNGFTLFGLTVARFQADEVVMRHCRLDVNDLKDFVKGTGDSKIRLLDMNRNPVNKALIFTKCFREEGLMEVTQIVHRNKVEILAMEDCHFHSDQLDKFKKSIPGVDFRYSPIF